MRYLHIFLVIFKSVPNHPEEHCDLAGHLCDIIGFFSVFSLHFTAQKFPCTGEQNTKSYSSFRPSLQSVLVCIQMYPAMDLQCVLQSARLCTVSQNVLHLYLPKSHISYSICAPWQTHRHLWGFLAVKGKLAAILKHEGKQHQKSSGVFFNSITCSFQSPPALKPWYVHAIGTYGKFWSKKLGRSHKLLYRGFLTYILVQCKEWTPPRALVSAFGKTQAFCTRFLVRRRIFPTRWAPWRETCSLCTVYLMSSLAKQKRES